jgi:quercetin dioxygenase-like cupin family protein
LQVGDVVHIPGGEKHWHGAAENTFMIHTAISLGGQLSRWRFGPKILTASRVRLA